MQLHWKRNLVGCLTGYFQNFWTHYIQSWLPAFRWIKIREKLILHKPVVFCFFTLSSCVTSSHNRLQLYWHWKQFFPSEKLQNGYVVKKKKTNVVARCLAPTSVWCLSGENSGSHSGKTSIYTKSARNADLQISLYVQRHLHEHMATMGFYWHVVEFFPSVKLPLCS